MAKLHEVLAVEESKKIAAETALNEAARKLEKPALFQAAVKTAQMFEENAHAPADERQAMSTTVTETVREALEEVAPYYDVIYQKEATNQTAAADLDVGSLYMTNLPATFLLGMEKRLRRVRDMIEKVPVLPDNVDWVQDATKGPGVKKCANPQKRFTTEKRPMHKVLYDATKDHPAQIEKWFEDVPVGELTLTVWNSAWSSARKATVLRRIDKLIEACVTSRQRANEAEVLSLSVGKVIVDYILEGIE